MSANIDKTYDLIRLVVQKMEIRTEADEQDDAEMPDLDVMKKTTYTSGSWATPSLQHTLMKQASIVEQWKSFDKK